MTIEAHYFGDQPAVRDNDDQLPACRVLLLGEDNPQSSNPEHSLYDYPPGCAGERLRREILGVSSVQYLGIWRTNLCNPSWSTRAARARAKLLFELVDPPWDTIVMLGAKVAGIAGYPQMPAFSSCTVQREAGKLVYYGFGEVRAVPPNGFQLVYLPHPSGRCRAWNDPGAVARARMVMRACVPEISWGAA